MKKFIIAIGITSSVLLSGCAAVVQGGASMAAGNAKSHPATQSFVVGMGKGDTFNASLRVLTAKGRKITSSDRESGVVQGEFDDNAVMIKIAEKRVGESTIDMTVAYNQTYLYGSAKLEETFNVLKSELLDAASKKKNTVADSTTVNPTSTAPVTTATKSKKKSKKITKAAVQE